MACGCQSDTTYPLELTHIMKHNNETISYDFTTLIPFNWYEGDSSKLYLTIDGHRIGKKFSFASLPKENIIRFTTRIRDDRSDYKDSMSRLSIGDIIDISQPSGEFKLNRDGRPALLLSNGVGIATMRSLIKSFELDSKNIEHLTQINIDKIGNIYRDEFENLAKSNTNFKSLYISKRNLFYDTLGFESQQLMLTTGLLPYVYIVGSNEFINDTISFLMTLGMSKNDILTDGPTSSFSGCGCQSDHSCGCGCSC